KMQYKDKTYTILSFVPNLNLTKAIVSSNKESQYRHSYFAYFFIYDFITKEIEPLKLSENDGKEEMLKLSYANWSPLGNYIYYIYNNNIYLKDISNNKDLQVTNDGSENVFNGKPDWVYEEEVLATDNAIYWSPNDENFIFLKTDETDVPVFQLEYYVQDNQDVYPKIVDLKYPKPGFSNPIVSLINYNIKSNKAVEIDHSDNNLGEDFILYDCKWIDNKNAIIKETDRESNQLNIRNFKILGKEEDDIYTYSNEIIRKVNAVEEFGGWIEETSDLLVIPPNHEQDRKHYGYVDVIVDENGFRQLAYFDQISNEKPKKILTNGNYDIIGGGLAFNYEKNKIYFLSAKKSSITRHLYTISLNGDDLQAITNDKVDEWNDVKLSPNGNYLLLSNRGPSVPTQKLFNINEDFDLEKGNNLATSDTTIKYLKKFQVPKHTFLEFEVDEGVKCHVKEILPTSYFDNEKNKQNNKTYPLLVNVYGGPGSQTVDVLFNIGFEDAVSSSLDAIVLQIEPRGTGGNGWKYKSFAKNQIGYWEPRDIVNIVEQYIKSHEGLVNTERTAIWGWSYGGFTTLKTLEYDAGKTIKYGMSVAPVTNWLFYDSIYTERYMDLPKNNEKGYREISVISELENFKSVKRFLIMHGTADDNVHFQNSLDLIDRFNLKTVENFDLKYFPDSNHGIFHHGANKIVYDKLFKWLSDAFAGDF
ncbi:uncharacterized protein ASCRUDRAFT_21804, partial [Ascoidea rubescens DSM 1968]